MTDQKMPLWEDLDREVIKCRKCPRLTTWREEVARTKRRAFIDEKYWGRPVPGFGDHQARVMVLGLAPGAHGSNRTGRMFTGDASGDFLYPALYSAGFASQPDSAYRGDGLVMTDMFITAVCRCVPPGNKPTREEQKNCAIFLRKEIELLQYIRGIVALGSIAFQNAFDLLKEEFHIQEKRPKFAHNALFTWQSCPIWLLASYHPSRQNTQTGRLSAEMFAAVWTQVRYKLEENG